MNTVVDGSGSGLTRRGCADALRRFESRRAPETGGRRAAVALAVLERAAGPVLLLTLRPNRMRAHPGQFALPGGGIDPGETPVRAALRELDEELGVRAGADAVLGVLDDFVTRSGYVITPVVVWVGPLAEALRPNPDEVASVFEVSEAELDAEPVLRPLPGESDPLFRWPFRGEHLFAPTAAIVHQFREVAVHGRATRVAGYRQPDFAAR